MSDSLKELFDFVFSLIYSAEHYFLSWPGWLQFLSAFAGILALIIALSTLLSTFRPLVTIDYTPTTEELTLDGPGKNFSVKTAVTVKNIGNRPARRVYLKSGRFIHGDQFILAAGKEEIIDVPFQYEKNLSVHYKRSLFNPRSFRSKLKESQSLFHMLRQFKPSSDLRTIAGRKKLRIFLKKASRRYWKSEQIEIWLFPVYNERSKVTIACLNKYSDSEYLTAFFDSSYLDLAFELEQIFGKSDAKNSTQEFNQKLSRKDFESRIDDFYIGSFLLDFIDHSRKVSISTEGVYGSTPKDRPSYPLGNVNSNSIYISTYSSSEEGHSRAVFLGGISNRIRTTDRFFHFDDDGFVSADTRRDLVQSQELGTLKKSTLVFLLSDKSTFISSAARDSSLENLEIDLENSKEIIKFVKSAYSLKNLNHVRYRDEFKKSVSTIFSYLIWSFKSPISQD